MRGMYVQWARRERRKSPLTTLFYVRRDRAVRSGLAHICSAHQRQSLHRSEGLLTTASMVHEVDERTPTALPTWKPVVSRPDVSCPFRYSIATLRPLLPR
jgi:hypothetical protein